MFKKVLCNLALKITKMGLAAGVAAGLSACGDGALTTAQGVETASVVSSLADSNGNLAARDLDSSVLAGVDDNDDGVRDDIEAYIAALPDDGKQKAALRQVSASLTRAMQTDTTNFADMLAVSSDIAAAAACLFAHYDSGMARKKSATMEKLTVNHPVLNDGAWI